jgi:putative transposase
MQIINWQTIYREPKTTMSNKEQKHFIYSKLKMYKNQVWATDITYSYGRFMYLTAIIDLHTRFVLNWA